MCSLHTCAITQVTQDIFGTFEFTMSPLKFLQSILMASEIPDWDLIEHPVCRRHRRRSVSLPAARRTREINSLRRFRPLVRNATPAGVARPPFVQLFVSSTGRPIYCPARYTASRRYLLVGKRATVRGRIDGPAIAISMRATRVILAIPADA